MPIIAFSNQKGGVGKTTCTRELGLWLCGLGRNVLLIDADPQANLSQSLTDLPGFGLYEALLGEAGEAEEIRPGLSLLSGGVKLAALEKSLVGELDAYTRMKDFLAAEAFRAYDFILIDCPPSLGILTVNALSAAEWLIIPMNPSLYSMQGTNDLMATVSKVRRSFNPGLNLLGVIVNAFDSVPAITRQIKAEIEEAFKEKVFQTSISRSIRIEEAIADRSGVSGRKKTKVAGEIQALGLELLARIVHSDAVAYADREGASPEGL
jgi:chromosome partitioning protein